MDVGIVLVVRLIWAVARFIVSLPWYVIVGTGVGLILLYRALLRLGHEVCDCNSPMDGKVVTITGADIGIGKEIARALLERGAKIILGCKSCEFITEIATSTGNRNIIFRYLDLESFNSVRDFAKYVLGTERKVDVLINNASIFAKSERVVTDDGCEKTIQHNHLGHFLLTNLLLDLMKKSAPSRIINRASGTYRQGGKNWDYFDRNLKYSELAAHRTSNLATVLFTQDLARRLTGTGVTANCADPGLVGAEVGNTNSLGDRMARFIAALLGKTPLEGAQTTIHLACSKELEKVTGKYFSECKNEEIHDIALDEDSADSLWNRSECVVGL